MKFRWAHSMCSMWSSWSLVNPVELFSLVPISFYALIFAFCGGSQSARESQSAELDLADPGASTASTTLAGPMRAMMNRLEGACFS